MSQSENGNDEVRGMGVQTMRFARIGNTLVVTIEHETEASAEAMHRALDAQIKATGEANLTLSGLQVLTPS